MPARHSIDLAQMTTGLVSVVVSGRDPARLSTVRPGDTINDNAMYVRHLLVKHCKLMHQLEVSFVRTDNSPRLWTVFVGENGACKTTLLRAIAISAAGGPFANSLVSDPSSYVDLRRDVGAAVVEASFGFSARFHRDRTYPKVEQKLESPPEVVAVSEVGTASVKSRANYGRWEARARAIAAPEEARAAVAAQWAAEAAAAAAKTAQASSMDDRAQAATWALEAARAAAGAAAAANVVLTNPIDDARAQDLPLWFAAGYGIGRVLSVPQSVTEGPVPKKDRLRSLFDPHYLPLGTGFSDIFASAYGEDRARAFARCLRTALIDRMRAPRLKHIELRGKGGANNQINLIESHRFALTIGGEELKLPAIWLSQGYQAVISLVADIIGNVWLEAGHEIELDDMEGLVLVDELDLHLHPRWQTEIVTGLKATFPRMQFIVTTHSPLVLAGCRADEVVVLAQDEATGDVTAVPGEVSPMLLTMSEMYREFFGVARTFASELGESLRRYIELASNPYRSDADDLKVSELRQHLLDNRVDLDYQPVARKTAS